MPASPVVCPGDRVRLLSPGSYPSREWLDESIRILEGWGLVVEVGAHAMDQHGYMAGTDQQRINDLNDAFRDPGVRAVITTRGGAGTYRIADCIDFDAVRSDPIPIVGFSDITNLQLSIWHQTGVPSIHGCLDGSNASSSVKQLLMSRTPLTLARDPGAMSASVGIAGTATGPLIGGNLREVAGSIGVRLPSLAGAILFLEEFRMIGLGQIDRQLNHLARSGAFDGICGVALGLFTGFDGYTDRGWTLTDVLNDQLGDLGVPVVGGFALGHGGLDSNGRPDQYAVAIGATAVLDSAAGTLTTSSAVT